MAWIWQVIAYIWLMYFPILHWDSVCRIFSWIWRIKQIIAMRSHSTLRWANSDTRLFSGSPWGKARLALIVHARTLMRTDILHLAFHLISLFDSICQLFIRKAAEGLCSVFLFICAFVCVCVCFPFETGWGRKRRTHSSFLLWSLGKSRQGDFNLICHESH